MSDRVVFLCLLTAWLCVHSSHAWLDCPALPSGMELKTLNVKGEGERESEFLCPAQWTNWEHMRGKLMNKLKGEKRFVRFRAPVTNYSNSRLGLNSWSGYVTWIWVAEKFNYLLYYPQNFQTLSLGTTDIISTNLDDDDIAISCSHCPNGTSCGIGYFELRDLMDNVTRSLNLDWEYLCIEADYGTQEIVSDYPEKQNLQMLNTRNFAFPDILYQWYFLKNLFSKCSFFTISCRAVPNYYCFHPLKKCDLKELLRKYNIIMYLAIAMWLFCPLLVYYLPSSQVSHMRTHVSGMIPTFKNPIYLGWCLQRVLCYYTSKHKGSSKWLIRLRRAIFLLLLAGLSFRLLLYPPYPMLSYPILVLCAVASLIPRYLSEPLVPEPPDHFPLFRKEFPSGLIKWSHKKEASREYQRLAYVMQERAFLVIDCRFWEYLCEHSFSNLLFAYKQGGNKAMYWLMTVCVGALRGTVTFICAVCIVPYYLLPLPFFMKELFCAITRGVSSYFNSQRRLPRSITVKICLLLTGFSFKALISFLLLYSILSLFSLCYLLTELAIITYIGASITPKMATQYVVLLISVGTAIYTMIHSLHQEYSRILEVMVKVFEDEKKLNHIASRVTQIQGMKLALMKNTEGGVDTQDIAQNQLHKKLYCKDEFVSHIRKGLFFSIAESLQPIRRQVLLFIVKTILMVFFIVVSMWVKNVYKSESQVSDIFSFASSVAVSFIPSILQVLSYRSHFGRSAEVEQQLEVADAIVDYVKQQSDLL